MTIRVKIKHDQLSYDKNIKVTRNVAPECLAIIHPGEEKEFHVWEGATLTLEETEDG